MCLNDWRQAGARPAQRCRKPACSAALTWGWALRPLPSRASGSSAAQDEGAALNHMHTTSDRQGRTGMQHLVLVHHAAGSWRALSVAEECTSADASFVSAAVLTLPASGACKSAAGWSTCRLTTAGSMWAQQSGVSTVSKVQTHVCTP
jgi:hypothetical protein